MSYILQYGRNRFCWNITNSNINIFDGKSNLEILAIGEIAESLVTEPYSIMYILYIVRYFSLIPENGIQDLHNKRSRYLLQEYSCNRLYVTPCILCTGLPVGMNLRL